MIDEEKIEYWIIDDIHDFILRKHSCYISQTIPIIYSYIYIVITYWSWSFHFCCDFLFILEEVGFSRASCNATVHGKTAEESRKTKKKHNAKCAESSLRIFVTFSFFSFLFCIYSVCKKSKKAGSKLRLGCSTGGGSVFLIREPRARVALPLGTSTYYCTSGFTGLGARDPRTRHTLNFRRLCEIYRALPGEMSTRTCTIHEIII